MNSLFEKPENFEEDEFWSWYYPFENKRESEEYEKIVRLLDKTTFPYIEYKIVNGDLEDDVPNEYDSLSIVEKEELEQRLGKVSIDRLFWKQTECWRDGLELISLETHNSIEDALIAATNVYVNLDWFYAEKNNFDSDDPNYELRKEAYEEPIDSGEIQRAYNKGLLEDC